MPEKSNKVQVYPRTTETYLVTVLCRSMEANVSAFQEARRFWQHQEKGVSETKVGIKSGYSFDVVLQSNLDNGVTYVWTLEPGLLHHSDGVVNMPAMNAVGPVYHENRTGYEPKRKLFG